MEPGCKSASNTKLTAVFFPLQLKRGIADFCPQCATHNHDYCCLYQWAKFAWYQCTNLVAMQPNAGYSRSY